MLENNLADRISTRILLLLSVIFSSTLFSQSKDSELRIRYANTISQEKLKKHLTILASDEYEGRETGEKGQKMAADYISAQFKKMGILPGAADTTLSGSLVLLCPLAFTTTCTVVPGWIS